MKEILLIILMCIINILLMVILIIMCNINVYY